MSPASGARQRGAGDAAGGLEPRLGPEAREFLTFLAVEKGRAVNSIRSYANDLAGYEEFLRARGIALADVTPPVMEDWLAFLRASGRRASSNGRALAAVRGLHRFCVDERGAPVDPSEDVAGPKVPQGIPKALTEEEVGRLLAAVVGEDARALRDRAILELLYATGMRISELCGLSVGDIDRKARLALVFGKGSKERVVPYGRLAGEALEAWLSPAGRATMAPARFARRDDEQAVFISTRGRRMSRTSGLRRGAHLRQARGPGAQGDAACAQALVRHAHARPRRRHPRRAGDARSRLDRDHTDLHQGLPGASPPDLPVRPPESACGTQGIRRTC